MAGTGEGKKEEAEYKRLHSFPLIRVCHCIHIYIHVCMCVYVIRIYEALVLMASYELVVVFTQVDKDICPF